MESVIALSLRFNNINSTMPSDFRIKSMAILTLLPVAPEVTVSREGCFEIYGFGERLS